MNILMKRMQKSFSPIFGGQDKANQATSSEPEASRDKHVVSRVASILSPS